MKRSDAGKSDKQQLSGRGAYRDERGSTIWDRLRDRLGGRIDAASLGVFRMSYGVVMLLQAVGIKNVAVMRAREAAVLGVDYDPYRFSYLGMGWLPAWSESAANIQVLLLAIFAGSLALGWFSRFSAAAVCVLFTLKWGSDPADFNNHYYLMSLIGGLLAVMPSGQAYGLDGYLARRKHGANRATSATVGRWTVDLLRVQLVIVYFYGGIAKISGHWIWHAEPIQTWLHRPKAAARIELLFPATVAEQMATEGFAFFMSNSGLVFDVVVGFLLLVPRTRLLMFVSMAGFHLFNHTILFDDIAMFPLLGILSSTIFLPSNWPRRLMALVRGRAWEKPDVRWMLGGIVVLPVAAALLAYRVERPLFLLLAGIPAGCLLGWRLAETPLKTEQGGHKLGRLPTLLIVGWIGLHTLLPLRHLLIAGDVNWTFEGDLFSWRMKSQHRIMEPIHFRIVDNQTPIATQQGGIAPDETRFGVMVPIDRDHVPWSGAPRFVVVFEPLTGHRVLYHSGASSPNNEEERRQIVQRVQSFWKEQYGHDPQVRWVPNVAQTMTALLAVTRSLDASGQIPKQIVALANRIEKLSRSTDEAAKDALRKEIQTRFQALAANPQCGAAVREVISAGAPLITCGVLTRSQGIVEIVDDRVMLRDRRGYRQFHDAFWRADWAESVDTFVDLDAFRSQQLGVLPQIYVVRDSDGQTTTYWNAFRDLLPYQRAAMQARPMLLHQYVGQICEEWRRRFASDPAVFADSHVAVVPYRMAEHVDADSNLAAMTLRIFSHNDWITPYEPELETRRDKADGGGNGGHSGASPADADLKSSDTELIQ